MDHDMRALHRRADVQRLLKAPGDDLAHLGFIAGDGEAPEGAVDAEAALVPVQKRPGFGGQARPVAVQHLGIDKGLQFQVARRFQQPVAVGGQAGVVKGGTKNGKIGHDRDPGWLHPRTFFRNGNGAVREA